MAAIHGCLDTASEGNPHLLYGIESIIKVTGRIRGKRETNIPASPSVDRRMQ